MNNTNQMNEASLMEYLRENHYPDLVASVNPVSRWDCYSPSFNHRIELKCRNKHYDELMIERKKYDAIMKIVRDSLEVPVYINSTPEGIYRWNLLDIAYGWFNKSLRKTTHFTNSNRIPKEIAMLPVVDAEIL